MSMSHLIILGIVILLVVPPDKLPEIMRNIGRLVSDFRRQTRGIFSDVTDEFRDMKSLTPEDMRKKIEDKKNEPI